MISATRPRPTLPLRSLFPRRLLTTTAVLLLRKTALSQFQSRHCLPMIRIQMGSQCHLRAWATQPTARLLMTPNTQTIEFVPSTGYTGPASFNYSISDELGGIGTGTARSTVNYPVTAESLFNTADLPSSASVNDRIWVGVGRQVPGLHHRRYYRDTLLQGPGEHGYTCGRSLERHGHLACQRHVHQRNGERVAAGLTVDAGGSYGGDHLCGVLPHGRKLLGGS